MVTYQVTVKRFNPERDAAPVLSSYTLEYEQQPTILAALRDIRQRFEPELAFRESCGFGKCGSCAVMQNGESVLACRTLLEEKALLEPLAQYPVIRDLVIDREDHERRLQHMDIHPQRASYVKKDEKPFQWGERFMDNAACIGCLVCQNVCPAYKRNPSAFPGPAALMQLGKMLHHNMDMGGRAQLAWSAGVHNCTACMRCEHACPKGLAPFRNGVVALRGAVKEGELEMPTMQAALSDKFQADGSIVGGPLKALDHPIVKEKADTVLYLGCMYANRYPKMGEKALDLLQQMGVEVCIPDGLACCGGPLMWVGDEKQAQEAIERNTRLFVESGAKRIVVPCPGCALTIKEDYREHYLKTRGEEFPLEVLDFTELLYAQAQGEAPAKQDAVKAVYHSPCHQGRGQGILEEALEILRRRPDVELLDFEGTDKCCGGMTSTSNPPAALANSREIVQDAVNAGAQIIITNCVFCRDNLSRAARRQGGKLKVLCLSEIL